MNASCMLLLLHREVPGSGRNVEEVLLVSEVSADVLTLPFVAPGTAERKHKRTTSEDGYEMIVAYQRRRSDPPATNVNQ